MSAEERVPAVRVKIAYLEHKDISIKSGSYKLYC